MSVFVKVMSSERAAAEVAGWQAVRGTLRVPKLLGCHPHGEDHAVVYEDVFANGRCQHLFGDCIALADHGIAGVGAVRDLVSGVCADLEQSAACTGRRTVLANCVPALYSDRLRPGGRLDTWYRDNTTLPVGTSQITIADLVTFEVIINGVAYRINIPTLIQEARRSLHTKSRWMTAITQGDPTEPNIAYPKVWLDFEHAGRNVLAGEAANLLWYLLGMGGWLVPKYQPPVYQRTLRYHLPPLAKPTAVTLNLSFEHRRIDVLTRWDVGQGRAAALDVVMAALRQRLGAVCADDRSSVMAALRPFLISRILGVIRLGSLDGTDTVLCLAKLAQLQDPRLTLDDLVSDLTVPEVAR